MNKFISLTKIQIKDFIGKAQSSLGVKKRIMGRLLMIALIAVLTIPAVTFSVVTYDAFASLGQPELVITMMYVNTVMLMFFLGIPFIVSIFFFSKDLRFLSSLPVREDALVFSKLTTVYLYLMGITLILLAPAVIVYMINSGFSFILMFMGLLALILAPVLPLLISSLLILPFSRLFSNSRWRNILVALFNILLLIGIIGIQLIINKYIASPETIQTIVENQGLLGLIGMRFPPSIWLTRMLLGSFADFVYFTGLNIILIFVLQTLARLFFRRSLLASGEENSKLSGQIYYKKHSKGYQLVKRHIMIIMKEPMFMMNTLLTLIVPVIMFVLLSFTGEFSLEMLQSEQIQPFMILIYSGILVSPAIIGNISATAITREGQSFWETRVMPVSAADNLKYRVLTTLFFNYLGSALLLVISIFILPVTVKMIFTGLLLCLTLTPFLATIDLIVNIYRPLLNWTNPTAAVKNNLNVIMSLGIRGVIALFVYLAYKIVPSVFQNNLEPVILAASGIFTLLYLVVRSYLYNQGVRQFRKISL